MEPEVVEESTVFEVVTPVSWLPKVTLYASWWQEHIVTQHTYMAGREDMVRSVVSEPSVVLGGSTTVGSANPNFVIMLNERIVSQKGIPLGVVVDPQDGEIRTAYFNRSLASIDASKILWKP